MLAFLLVGALLLAAAPPKPLAIVKPTLRQYEDGPATQAGFRFVTGESVFLSFQIQGYQASPGSQVALRYQIDAVDPHGVRLVDIVQKEIKTTLSPEDKEWMPLVRWSFLIPPLALPGVYRVLVSVQDTLAGKETRTELEFPVSGRQVEPSDTLVARNFRFLRSEDDPHPLEMAAYHPGDALWARFEITGFRYGPNNKVHVEYGLAVLGPTGKTLYSEPRAAVEQDESFYPKRYLPGILSLNLQKNTRPAQYTIVLTLRDEIGNQTQESKHEFKIE